MEESTRVASHRVPHIFGGIPPLRDGLRDGLAQLEDVVVHGGSDTPRRTRTWLQKFRQAVFEVIEGCLEPATGTLGAITSMRNYDQQTVIAATPLLKAAKDASMAAFNVALREICKDQGIMEEEAVVVTVGAEGETAAHLCMLYHTRRHVDMATKLFNRFGEPLINAPYHGTSYKGETPLHMAIEKRNADLVRLLCQLGANVHARATGTFFRKRKTGSDDTYFGEYPLSFAIATGQPELAIILLAAGADPYKQDSYGNTALHIAVLKKQPAMYSFLRTWVDISETGEQCEPDDEPAGGSASKRTRRTSSDNLQNQGRAAANGKEEELDPEEDVEDFFARKRSLPAGTSRPETADLPAEEPSKRTNPRSPDGAAQSPSEGSEKSSGKGKPDRPPQRLWEVRNGRKPGKGGLTPLEYAARLGDANVFDHVFREEREELWRYWTVKSTVIDVDSLERCLDVAIMHRSWDLLMLPTIYEALHWKWKRFARQAFVWSALRYLAYLVVCFTTATFCGDRVFGARSYVCPKNINHNIGFAAEIATSAFSVTYLMHDMYEAEELRAFKSLHNFWRFVEGPDVLKLSRWVHCVLVMATILARRLGRRILADCLLATAMLCGWVRLLYTCAIFPMTGMLVSVIVEILFRDVGRFLIIYCILLWGFSQSLLVLFRFNHAPSAEYPDLQPTPGYDGPLRALGSLFQLTITNYEWDELRQSPASGLVYTLFILFVILVLILLLNLLIARMNTTYSMVAEKAEKTFRSQWARFIVHRQKRLGMRTQQRVALPGRQPQEGEQRKWYITETITEEEAYSAAATFNATSREEKAYKAWSLARTQVTNALRQRVMNRVWMDDQPYTSQRSFGQDSGLTLRLSRSNSRRGDADSPKDISYGF